MPAPTTKLISFHDSFDDDTSGKRGEFYMFRFMRGDSNESIKSNMEKQPPRPAEVKNPSHQHEYHLTESGVLLG